LDSSAIIGSLGTFANSPASSWLADLTTGSSLLNLFSIILINIVLSGDNSVVIAMAVHSLPSEKRLKGILIGTLGAVLLRVFFTLIASHLLEIQFLKIVGGATILWIAIKLLVEEAESAAHRKPIQSVWHAVWIILVADLTMSLDNVLAVAGVCKGNVLQLWLSLGLSIPLVVFASTMLSKLMDKYPFIIILGAAMLGKVGAEMIYTDPFWNNWFKMDSGILKMAFEGICVLGILGAAKWIEYRMKISEEKNLK